MSEKPQSDWLDLALKDPLQVYCEHFECNFPRPEIIKHACSYGGLDANKQLLTEHVLADQPVSDWSEFARELLRRAGRL